MADKVPSAQVFVPSSSSGFACQYRFTTAPCLFNHLSLTAYQLRAGSQTSYGSRNLGGDLNNSRVLMKENSYLPDGFSFLFIQLQQVSFS
jgi:hypothetical protein